MSGSSLWGGLCEPFSLPSSYPPPPTGQPIFPVSPPLSAALLKEGNNIFARFTFQADLGDLGGHGPER